MAREMDPSRTATDTNQACLGLQRQETFKLSIDPLFVDQACDIVGLYRAHAHGDGLVRG